MSATTPSAIHVDNLNNLMGPLYVGTILNWFLLGTLVVQVYHYIHAFPNDRKPIKAVVYFVLLLDCIQTGLTSSTGWDYMVRYWGNTQVLLQSPTTGISIPLFSALIGLVVQFFFSWRIWSLKRGSMVFTGVSLFIIAVAITQCIAAWVSAFRFLRIRDINELPTILAGFTLWLSASLACDVFIAAAMLVILTEARRRTPFKDTNTIISRLVAHTIQTGAITAITAAVEIALFVTFPTDNKHDVPALILGKLYSNCLVATLNARQGSYLSTQNETGNSNISNTIAVRSSSNGLLSPRSGKNSKTAGVSIETVQSVSGDDGVRMDQHAVEMKPYTPWGTTNSKASFEV